MKQRFKRQANEIAKKNEEIERLTCVNRGLRKRIAWRKTMTSGSMKTLLAAKK